MHGKLNYKQNPWLESDITRDKKKPATDNQLLHFLNKMLINAFYRRKRKIYLIGYISNQ